MYLYSFYSLTFSGVEIYIIYIKLSICSVFCMCIYCTYCMSKHTINMAICKLYVHIANSPLSSALWISQSNVSALPQNKIFRHIFSKTISGWTLFFLSKSAQQYCEAKHSQSYIIHIDDYAVDAGTMQIVYHEQLINGCVHNFAIKYDKCTYLSQSDQIAN